MIERIMNGIAAIVTILTFLASFYPAVNNNQANLPNFLDEPLSLIRYFIGGLLLVFCNYGISYPTSVILKGKFNRATRNAFYGMFAFTSAWTNISIIKYILFGKIFYINWHRKGGTWLFGVGYILLVLFSVILLCYLIVRHLEDDDYLKKEFSNDFLFFLIPIYLIIVFSSLAFNPATF
jgi:hypothetical protein